MKKRIIVILSLVCLVLSPLMAQVRSTGLQVLIRPSEYVSGPHRVLKQSPKSTSTSKQWWTAFSDRDMNVTYMDPDSNSAVVSRLNFCDALFVVGETDDYCQVIAYDQNGYDRNTGLITKDLTSYGWIPKSRLILWRRSLVDSKTKFARKCLAVNTISSLHEIEAYSSKDELKLFTQPGGSKLSGSKVLLYNFVYVFKEEGNHYLIGKKMRVVEGSVKDDILGWVSKDVVQQWTHRLALQPNGEGAGEERRRNNTPVKIFTSLSDAQNYSAGIDFTPSGTVIPYEDKYSQSYNAFIPRLPILAEVSKEPLIYQTGALTPVFNSENEEVMDVDQQAEINEGYEEVRMERSNVNIVFVVDASENMRRYTRPICTAIRNVTYTLSEVSAQADLEYGVVAYRSVQEGACGNKELEAFGLSSDEQAIINFLSRDLMRDDCAAETDYRSVFKALNRGLDMFRKSSEKGQTNILVLIGAKGNDDKNFGNRFELTSKMAELNCSLMVFQVKNVETDESYARFYSGINDAIRDSEKMISQKHRDIWPTEVDIMFVAENSDEFAVRMPFPEDAPVPGSLVWTPSGEPMSTQHLEDEVRKVILDCVSNNERLFAKGDAQVRGMGKRVVMDEAVRNMLRQIDVDLELLKRSSFDNVQFFWEGYTPMYRQGNENPFYEYVLHLSYEEINELLTKLSKLVEDDGMALSAQREAIADAFKQLAAEYLGQHESKSKINIMTLEDVLNQLYGLPGYKRSKAFMGIKIDEIQSLDNTEVHEIIDYFGKQLALIREFIEADNNKLRNFGDDYHSEVYYWMPQRLLP